MGVDLVWAALTNVHRVKLELLIHLWDQRVALIAFPAPLDIFAMTLESVTIHTGLVLLGLSAWRNPLCL